MLVTVHARAYPRLLERAVERGAAVHTPSAFVADEVIDTTGIDPARVHVIHNGFAAGDLGNPNRGRDLAGGEFVLAIGTVEPRKDLPTLVTSMPAVWAELPDIRLVIVGGDGWGSEALDRAVSGLSPAQRRRVVRLGYVSDRDRADLLSGARCLAFPSLYEGFGLPPLEAMARSTPVVTTTAGALPEICGDAARFVPPSDPTELGAAIVEVSTNEHVRAQLVDTGLRRSSEFSWVATTRQMVALYHRLARGPG